MRALRVGARKDAGGFSLIELLVVILIVAILAAVSIPLFLRQKEKGYADQIQSSLKNAATAVETYATENNGSYAGLDGQTGTDLAPYGWSPPLYPYLAYLRIKSTASRYCLEARHEVASATAEWRDATYQSNINVPQPEPDVCP